MVAFYSFGSQRAAQAMGDDYLQHLSDRGAAASAQTRSGWAIVEQLFPGRVYDHMSAVPLFARSHPEAREVWLGEFGDTVVCMVPSNVEYQRRNQSVGADRPVRAELVEDEDERVTIAYVDRVAGIDRFVEITPGATRGVVRGSARGAPLPFEESFLDGSDDEVFPSFRYLQEARSWLFAISSPPRRGVPPAAMMVRGYLLGPVDEPLPLADGRPVVDLQPPDELADLLAGAEFLDEHDGRYVADGSGDWFQLHRVDADHALLVGWDAEDTETFFGAAVSYFSASEETDLLAGVPEWWADLVRTRHAGAFSTDAGFDPINIVCGWDGRQWTKAIGAPDLVLLYQFLEPEEDD